MFMTKKDFVIGLIETEIDRDLTQRAAMNDYVHTESEEISEKQKEAQEAALVNDYESVSEEVEKEHGEQEDDDFSEDFEAKEEEQETLDEDEELEEELDEDEEQCEDENMIEEEEESEGMVMSMGMQNITEKYCVLIFLQILIALSFTIKLFFQNIVI